MTDRKNSITDLRSVAAGLLALTVKELFPRANIGKSGTTSLGFYCDFLTDISFTPEILQEVEERMERSIWEGKEVSSKEMTPYTAREYFLYHKEPWLASLADSCTSSTIPLVDISGKMFFAEAALEVSNLKELGVIKIYKSEVLEGFQKRVRIHGALFQDKQERKAFVKTSKNIIGTSHVNVGLEKKLFEEVEEGRWIWLPNGQKVRAALKKRLSQLLEEQDFLSVSTIPIMETFSSKKTFSEHKNLLKKGLVSKERLAVSESITICESEDRVFPSGLLDTSVFEINSSHLFCLRESLLEEVISCLHFMTKIFKILDFAVEIVLVGKAKSSEAAVLTKALGHLGVEPSKESDRRESLRIEWRVQDRMGKSWPVSCLYTPVKLAQEHCSCLPISFFLSLERIIALLIESKKGEIPAWLLCEV